MAILLGGVYRAMKVTALLIFWSLPVLQPPGGHDRPPGPAPSIATPQAHREAASHAWAKTRKAPLPAVPSRKNLCLVPVDNDEEESSEDAYYGDGLPLARLWRSMGQCELLSLAQVPLDLSRLTSRLHPLRC
jgi:hypothetical protein